MPFSHACQGATTSHRPVRSRRDHIEGHGEYDIDEYQQSANEPCRTTAVRNEVAVTVAIITIVTAPGQNCRSIGLGPTA